MHLQALATPVPVAREGRKLSRLNERDECLSCATGYCSFEEFGLTVKFDPPQSLRVSGHLCLRSLLDSCLRCTACLVGVKSAALPALCC